MALGAAQPPLGAVQALAVDLVTAEVVGALRAAGVRCILLKGPSIARWVYDEDGERSYGDSDLLVPLHQQQRAEGVLRTLGFVDSRFGVPAPAWCGTQWLRPDDPGATGHDNVDLHVTIPGLGIPPERAFHQLARRTEPARVGGIEVEVLAPMARTLHLALHAASSGPDVARPLEDLAAGLRRLPPSLWEEAATLAEELQALPAMGAGLGRLSEGAALARRLGLPCAPLVEPILAATPLAGGFARLASLEGGRTKALFLARKVWPPPAVLRWKYPWSGSGGLPLVRAYLTWWARVARRGPTGFLAWRRARRRIRTGGLRAAAGHRLRRVLLRAPLHLRALVLLAAVRLLLPRAGLTRTVRLIDGAAAGRRWHEHPPDRLVRAVDRMAAAALPGSACLARSVAVICLLRGHRNRSAEPELVLGCRRDERGWGAHAWIELGGMAVTGLCNDHTELARCSAATRWTLQRSPCSRPGVRREPLPG